MPEKVVASDQWGQVIYYDEWDSLELRWLPSTANADDAALRTTMEVFANEAVNRRPKTLIVDTTQFNHTWGDGLMQWRDAHIIPRYGAAGVRKFAFVMPPGFPDSGREAVEGPAVFPTKWFLDRQQALAWLAAG